MGYVKPGQGPPPLSGHQQLMEPGGKGARGVLMLQPGLSAPVAGARHVPSALGAANRERLPLAIVPKALVQREQRAGQHHT